MNILVVGCGKMGARLSMMLCRMGHDISVIDRDAEAFDLLDEDFAGLTITGVPIDQDVLRRAGIEGCDAVAVVTANDNINVMVSQIAHEIFKVPKVLTRIYDPKRDLIYSEFGMHTICPTSLSVDSAISMLTRRDDIKFQTFGPAKVAFSTIAIESRYNGFDVRKINTGEEGSLFGVLHTDGQMSLVTEGTNLVVHDTDKLILAKIVNRTHTTI